MKAEIGSYSPEYMARIAQLTNKSNQFNLTTKRFTQAELEQCLQRISGLYLDLYGRLTDRFGDNGVVSVILGRKEERILHIELWLMSCRVLKRDMEKAMLDALVIRSKRMGISVIRGYYIPTAKNQMVKDFYGTMGFGLTEEREDKSTVWELETETYRPLLSVIEIRQMK